MAVQGNSPLQVWIVGDDTGGGGGGGGAVTIADGADVALGATTDAESASGNGTVIAILKRIRTLMGAGLPTVLNATDTLRVALYAKSSSDGDKAVRSSSGGILYVQELVGNYSAPSITGESLANGLAPAGTDPLQMYYNVAIQTFLDRANGTLTAARPADKVKSVSSDTLANATSLNVWDTSITGYKWSLMGAWVRVSSTGRYQLRDNNTPFLYTYLAANTWTNIMQMEKNGYLSSSGGNILKFYNNSGSSADVDIVLVGTEI